MRNRFPLLYLKPLAVLVCLGLVSCTPPVAPGQDTVTTGKVTVAVAAPNPGFAVLVNGVDVTSEAVTTYDHAVDTIQVKAAAGMDSYEWFSSYLDYQRPIGYVADFSGQREVTLLSDEELSEGGYTVITLVVTKDGASASVSHAFIDGNT